MTVQYRVVDDIDDLERMVDLEIDVWGLDVRDAVPSNIMRAMIKNGGVAVGAYDGDVMIGMALAFPSFRNAQVCLWSHMAAVLPAYQRRGIGAAIKFFQRDWARAYGYNQIRWTFDPLQRGNAHFNFNLLGIMADTYHIDAYGVMNDAINKGMPSDRLEAVWKIDRQDFPSPLSAMTDIPPLLAIHDGQPQPISLPDVHEVLAVEIPHTIQHLSRELMFSWRLALREAFTWSFDQGYHTIAFSDLVDKGVYVLSKVR
jgi:predicted GNAT superfamily acetyltransferase